MYSLLLEKLNPLSQFSSDEIRQVASLLYLIKSQGYNERFHPRVYKRFGFSIDEKRFIQILNELSRIKVLDTNFELCCPQCHETIAVYKNYSDFPVEHEINCIFCGFDFEATDDDLFQTYGFSKDSDLFATGGASDDNFFNSVQVIPHDRLNLQSKKLSYSEMISLYPEVIINDYISRRRDELKKHLNQLIDAEDNKTKGDSLEDFTQIFFEINPYLSFFKKKFLNETGEVDVIFQVKKIHATLFAEFSDLLLIECKNTSKSVGAADVRIFSTKMKEFNTKVGFIIAKNGVSGDDDFIRDAKGYIRNFWLSEKQIIIVFDLNDLKSIVYDNNCLYEKLKEKYFSTKMMSA